MLKLPVTNEWGLIIPSTADGTRPAAAFGTSVTPAQNAYGAYVTLIAGASLTADCYELEIRVDGIGVTSAARDGVISIGLDPAGGTSFTSLVDLVCGPTHAYNTGGGGTFFRFLIFIKAGTSIGVAGAVNSATLTAFNVSCIARCQPSRPDLIYAGGYIDEYGVTLASSNGTAITPGTTSDGTYTLIGTLSRPCRYLEFGYGVNNATMSIAAIHVDIAIGDGVSFKQVIQNSLVITDTAEKLTKRGLGDYGIGATGDKLYARAQVGPSAPDTGQSIAIYAVGG